MLGYLSTDIICSEKRTVLRERTLRKTVSLEEHIMSKNKYPSIFSPQIETIVFIILHIFFATHAVLKIGGYSQIFPSFSKGNIRSHDMFRPIARTRKYLMDHNLCYQQFCFTLEMRIEIHNICFFCRENGSKTHGFQHVYFATMVLPRSPCTANLRTRTST